MLVSIFGQLEYGDYSSVLDWGGAHAQAHRTIQRVVTQMGNPLQPVLLGPEHIDDDWFGRHGIAHASLARFYPGDATASATMMLSSLKDWETQQSFYDWHMMHDQLHYRLNQALGITA
jgi:hypothetical protein